MLQLVYYSTCDYFTVFLIGKIHASANVLPHMEMQPEIVPNKATVIKSAQPDTPPVSSVPTSAVSSVPPTFAEAVDPANIPWKKGSLKKRK